MMVTDIEVEKDLLSQPEETQVQNIECPHSKVIKIETEELSNLEGTGVEKLELSHFDDNQNPVNIVTLHPRDHIQPEDGDLELPTGDCLLEDRCLVRPAAAGTTTKAADSCIDINANCILGSSGKDDRTNLDLKNQLDSVTPNEIFLEIKGKDETNEELSNEVSGMELSNGVMAVQSLVGNGTKEEKLNNEETGRDSTLNNETKKDIFPDGVTRLDMLPENEPKEELIDGVTGMDLLFNNEVKEELQKSELDIGQEVYMKTSKNSFIQEPNGSLGDETGTEEEQAAFMKELENFHKERCLEFKAPRFYGEPLNCLKLWRAVIKLGGYEQVTSCKLWRQVGESFKPPKTCTTVSWTFRCFYEKALLEYEKHKMRNGELPFADASFTEPSSAGNLAGLGQSSGSGRARRDAAARAMQGWHSQRLLGNGEVGDPIIKDKNLTSIPKREKQLKSIGVLKRKTPSTVERAVKVARMKALKPQLENMVVDIGSPADWVKINVQRTKDCFEVYALVPGLLREEVRVQSDPAGRLVISGQPEHIDSPWGITPFKKVVSLPSRIDPHQTSAVVTLHGQLFVRVPFEQSDT